MSGSSVYNEYRDWLEPFKKSHPNYKSIPHYTKVSLFIKDKTGKSYSSAESKNIIDWYIGQHYITQHYYQNISQVVDAYQKHKKPLHKVAKSFSNFKMNKNFTPRLARHRHPTTWSGK